jgi:hypothetical protein
MNNSILKKIAHLAYQIAGCSLSTPEKPKPRLDKLGKHKQKSNTSAFTLHQSLLK